MCIGLPAASRSRSPVPHGRTTPQSAKSQRRTRVPIFIPVTTPIEPFNGEIKRRAEVVGIFPNEDAIVHLIGPILLENDEWAVQRARYMTLETSRG